MQRLVEIGTVVFGSYQKRNALRWGKGLVQILNFAFRTLSVIFIHKYQSLI